MRVASLHLYPIKGCRGHSVSRLEFDRAGVVGDRRLMLVDENGRFVSQREVAALATVDPLLDGPMLALRTSGGDSFSHELPNDGAMRDVRIWGDSVVAMDQGDAVAEWFSDVMKKPLRLVSWTEQTRRLVDARYSPRDDAETTFNDAYPALLVTEASLSDLNARLAQPVPMARFRPTIVVSGGEPWGEDDWRVIEVGAMTFDAVKPCARCVVTTTDQASGMRHPEQEPLRTLATFRTIRGLGAIFGQNLVHRGVGAVAVGDRVEIDG
jgi:uncharacterized protein YcbX